MLVTQIAEIMNGVTSEILGEGAVVNEDLSNIIDIGNQIFDATSIDNYVRSLVDKVGRVVFVSRPYAGGHPLYLETHGNSVAFYRKSAPIFRTQPRTSRGTL